MAVRSFDFRKAPPAEGGGMRDDYITPGKHRFKVIKYNDADSAGGKEMHTYQMEVVGRRDEDAGKKLTDRFALPDLKSDPKASLFPLQRLHAFFIACGAKDTRGKVIKIDPARLVGKELTGEVYDERQEARTDTSGKTYPAATRSRIGDYIDPNKEDEDEDEPEDDEDEEDLEDEDDDEDAEDEDDEEEEEVPAPRARRAAAPTRNGATAVAAKPKAKAKAKAVEPDDDEDEFPFDSEDDEEEEEPAPRRRAARR